LKAKAEYRTITGPVGDIELRVKLNAESLKNRLVVLSHPHPLYGGTMDNKVITTMERAFFALGYNTVAYNFRGVGKTAGEYDNGAGEQKDLNAVIDWANLNMPVDYIVLAGFSFGSYVTLKAMAECEVDALCTVAPPVGLYDLSNIEPITVPWTLIQGGEDEVVNAQEILDWATQQENVPDIYWRANASHFFHGELVWLKKLIEMNF